MNKRIAFFISDSTGITAETLGQSLLAQFSHINFEKQTIPYVNSIEIAQEVLEKINSVSHQNNSKVLVFSTLADAKIRNILAACNGLFMDFFDILMTPLETELNAKYAQDIGKFHSILDVNRYDQRIFAMEFALSTDDGIGVKNYKDADVIITGVSRCGKTPTCLYMALTFGVRAANYPITEEDMHATDLPDVLKPYVKKLFGLTISEQRLHSIRAQRRPNSKYASIEQCKTELSIVNKMFEKDSIPKLNSTIFSIEEISTKIMAEMGVKRRTL